jgi:L-alanine-DL-glutamate epimerase-like enolase superfamily enzyme
VRAFYYDWYGKLVTELPPIERGTIRAPAGPGLGTRLQPGIAQRKDARVKVSKL